MILFAIVLAVVAASMALLGIGVLVTGRRLENGCARWRNGDCPCARENGVRCARPGAEGDTP